MPINGSCQGVDCPETEIARPTPSNRLKGGMNKGKKIKGKKKKSKYCKQMRAKKASKRKQMRAEKGNNAASEMRNASKIEQKSSKTVK